MKPSHSLLTVFNFFPLAAEVKDYIYQCKVNDPEIYTELEIMQFPTVIVFEKTTKNQIFRFIGSNHEKSI